MNDITVSCIFMIGMLIAVMFSLPSFPAARGGNVSRGRRRTTEQGYLIRRNDGYPMTVNRETVDKAIATGDYIYEGPATYETAGGFYFNDDGYVPGGHIVVDGSKFEDERLN